MSKTFVYGTSGYGKSYRYSRPMILDNENVILLTPNQSINNELSYMDIEDNFVKEVDVDDISFNLLEGRIGYVINNNEPNKFLRWLNGMNSSNVVSNPNYNVIIESISIYEKIMCLPDIIYMINKWKCNVLCVMACSEYEVNYFDVKDMESNFKSWKFISVFSKLYDKKLKLLMDSLTNGAYQAEKFTDEMWKHLDKCAPETNMQCSIMESILHLLAGKANNCDYVFLSQFDFWKVLKSMPIERYSLNTIENIRNRLLELMKKNDCNPTDCYTVELLLRYIINQSKENEDAFNSWFSFKIYDLIGKDAERNFKYAFALKNIFKYYPFDSSGKFLTIYSDKLGKWNITYNPFSRDWIYCSDNIARKNKNLKHLVSKIRKTDVIPVDDILKEIYDKTI